MERRHGVTSGANPRDTNLAGDQGGPSERVGKAQLTGGVVVFPLNSKIVKINEEN